MDRETIVELFDKIRYWRRGDRRAPHKPLLVLYALAKLQSEGTTLHPYSVIDEELSKLLREFGPYQNRLLTHDPFWRLQIDNVWHVTNAENVTEDNSRNVKPRELLEYNVCGGFREEIVEKLQSDPTLYIEVAQMMLKKAFSDAIHTEVLQAVNIEFPPQVFETRSHSTNFRNTVLKAYEYKCAVCGFDAKLGTTPLALDASHIKWKSYNGPDKVINGICLCVMHHKLFDLGAFTLSKDLHMLVSDEAHGTKGFNEWLKDFHGDKITRPNKQIYLPDLEFIGWHVREVFRGEYRDL